MNMQLVNEITKSQIKTDVPQFKAGDTLKVFVKIQEGNKTRLQMFEGVCIAKKGHGIGETFTVRKISYGVGVERVFPVNSPIIDHIEVAKVGKVRRAKLPFAVLADHRGCPPHYRAVRWQAAHQLLRRRHGLQHPCPV